MKNKNNKVSIIVPIYNAEKYLNRCIDSIIEQTYKNIEIILINDGSKDNSLKICKSYKDKYPNIINIINQTNQGVSKARNNGIKKSTGEYIMFIDNDDYIDKKYIETYLNEIIKDDSDIVIGGYKRVTNNKVLFSKKIKNEVYKLVNLAPWAKIYKKEFLLKNNLCFLDYPLGEDVYLNINSYSKTDKIKLIDFIGYNWFYNTESVSNKYQNTMKEEIDPQVLLNKILNSIKNNKMYNKEFYDYFFIRYVIWYLLYSARKTKKELIIKRYNELFNFLDKNNINYKKNKYKSMINYKSDEFKTKLIINFLLTLKRIKLIKVFLILYSKL